MTNQDLTYLVYLCYVLSSIIILAAFYVIFNTFYTSYSKQKKIRKESLYLLDIVYEEEYNKKLDPTLFEKAMFLVDCFCMRNIFDISLEPCGTDEISINIKNYSVYMSLTKEKIEGWIDFGGVSAKNVKFNLSCSTSTWANDVVTLVKLSMNIKERK